MKEIGVMRDKYMSTSIWWLMWQSNISKVYQLQGIHTLSQPMHHVIYVVFFDNAIAKMLLLRWETWDLKLWNHLNISPVYTLKRKALEHHRFDDVCVNTLVFGKRARRICFEFHKKFTTQRAFKCTNNISQCGHCSRRSTLSTVMYYAIIISIVNQQNYYLPCMEVQKGVVGTGWRFWWRWVNLLMNESTECVCNSVFVHMIMCLSVL